MKVPWLTEDQKFAIGATIIFVGAAIVLSMLYGCASVFDAPPKPLHETKKANFDTWRPTDIQPCIIGRQGIWLMVDEVRNCRGWTPI